MIVPSGQNVTVVPVRSESPVRYEWPCGLAAVDERLLVVAAVAVDLELEPARQRVHDRHADAVQAAGDLVALAAELAAGVEHREHDLGRRLVGVLGVRIDGNPATVVDDAATAVGEQRDVDARRVTREGLVDRVVDDLVDQVVQPASDRSNRCTSRAVRAPAGGP